MYVYTAYTFLVPSEARRLQPVSSYRGLWDVASPGFLQKQKVVLTSEPCLQPWNYIFYCYLPLTFTNSLQASIKKILQGSAYTGCLIFKKVLSGFNSYLLNILPYLKQHSKYLQFDSHLVVILTLWFKNYCEPSVQMRKQNCIKVK